MKPSRSWTRFCFGSSERQLSKIDRVLVLVISVVAFAVIFRPTIARLNTWRGDQLAMTGKQAEAAPAYRKALLLDPTFLPPRLSLAQAYFKLGRYAAAADQYEAALAINPADDEAHFYLGLIAFKRGDYSEAREHFSRPRLKSEFGLLAARMLARALEKDGRYQEAIRAWRRMQRLYPGSATDVVRVIDRIREKLRSSRRK